MQGIDADAVRTPFERGDASKLIECRLGGGIGGSPWAGRGNVFRADHHHAPAARRELQQRMAGAQQDKVGVEIHAHRLAPFVGRKLGDLAARGKDACVQDEHVQAAEGDDGAADREPYLRIVGHVTA